MFSDILYVLLDEKRISQKTLAYKTGISESTLSKFLSNTKEPKRSEMVSIAKVLKVNPLMFFRDTYTDNSSGANTPIIIGPFYMHAFFNDTEKETAIIKVMTLKDVYNYPLYKHFLHNVEQSVVVKKGTIILKDDKMRPLNTLGANEVIHMVPNKGYYYMNLSMDSVIYTFIMDKNKSRQFKNWMTLIRRNLGECYSEECRKRNEVLPPNERYLCINECPRRS